MPNRLNPHLLKGLAGLSEDLLESYGDSWDYADEGGVYHYQYKVPMIFADMHDEIFSLFDICYDKIGSTENPNQTCSCSNWTCFK